MEPVEQRLNISSNTSSKKVAAAQIYLPESPITLEDIDLIKSHLLANIATYDHVFTKICVNEVHISIPGAVIASPSLNSSHFSQDYFFHWVRDAGIVMNELVYLYHNSEDQDERNALFQYFINYIYWNKIAQQQPSVNGINVLGEPKYNIDATVWQGEWSRPQNDGPALRAISLLHIANIFLQQGEKQFVADHLFNKHLAYDKMGIIKTDLEYIANHWNYRTAGLWEEVFCYHFFTEAVQRRALIYGATLAETMNDHEAAYYYLAQAKLLEQLMLKHWNDSRGYYSETLQYHDWKGGGLNSSILLGIMYGHIHTENDLLSALNSKVISTAYHIRYAFEGLYHLNIKNKMNGLGGPLIGRYPDDIYDGNHSQYGNPWILTSAILAKYYYALARILLNNKHIEISLLTWPFYQQLCPQLKLKPSLKLNLQTDKKLFINIINGLLTGGDLILKNIKHYSISYGKKDHFHLPEQLDRSNGKEVSAKDLTWGYSTILSACRSRKLLINSLNKL